MRKWILLAIVLGIFFLFPAQVDWESLGVNVTLVGLIIGLTQFLKAQVFKTAPGWVFMIVTMAISGVVGYFSAPEMAGAEDILKLVFTYITASAWLYNVAKRVPGVGKLFKDGQDIKKKAA